MNERLQELTADEMREVLGGISIVEKVKEALQGHKHDTSVMARRLIG